MVQCIWHFNGEIDGVDLLEGFTVDELKSLLNMASVAWCNNTLCKVSVVIHCEIPHWAVLHNILTLNLTLFNVFSLYYNNFIIYEIPCDASRMQIKILYSDNHYVQYNTIQDNRKLCSVIQYNTIQYLPLCSPIRSLIFSVGLCLTLKVYMEVSNASDILAISDACFRPFISGKPDTTM